MTHPTQNRLLAAILVVEDYLAAVRQGNSPNLPELGELDASVQDALQHFFAAQGVIITLASDGTAVSIKLAHR